MFWLCFELYCFARLSRSVSIIQKCLHRHITFTKQTKHANHRCFFWFVVFRGDKHSFVNTERAFFGKTTIPITELPRLAEGMRMQTARLYGSSWACLVKKFSRLRDVGESGRMASHFDGKMMDGRERYCRQDTDRRAVFTSDVAEVAGVCSSAGDCQSHVALSLHTSVPRRRRPSTIHLGLF